MCRAQPGPVAVCQCFHALQRLCLLICWANIFPPARQGTFFSLSLQPSRLKRGGLSTLKPGVDSYSGALAALSFPVSGWEVGQAWHRERKR